MPDIPIDDETLAHLERLAADRRCSVGELIRDFATFPAVTPAGSWPTPDLPTTLTVYQREQLAIQHEVYSWLYTMLPDVDGDLDLLENVYDEHVEIVEILRNGWTAQYERVFAKVRPEVPMEVCLYVKHVLSMFSDLASAVEALPGTDRATLGSARLARLRFRGFGVSGEREIAGYAQYLLTDDLRSAVRRFPGVVDDGLIAAFPWAGDTGHAEEYFRMLAEFERATARGGVDEDELLDLSDLRSVADAADDL